MKSLSPVNAFLEVIALMNLGADHGPTYALYELENIGNIVDDIENYFKLGTLDQNVNWQVKTDLYDGNWENLVRAKATKWFFEERYSPKVEDWVMTILLETFLRHLKTATQAQSAYRLQTNPAEFYEVVWEDLILEANGKHWLLHFGWSD